jgi:hypothetical protein
MNRILKRPMFRIGGSAGTGITSGLNQPRAQYANGSTKERLLQAIGQPSNNRNLGQFLTTFGLDLLSRPPQGGFFSTVAQAAKAPTEQLFSDLDARRNLERQVALTAEQSDIEFGREKELAEINRKDKREAIEKKARVMSQTKTSPFFGDYEGALNQLVDRDLYGVLPAPGEERAKQIQKDYEFGMSEPGVTLDDSSVVRRKATLLYDRNTIEKDNDIKLGVNPFIVSGNQYEAGKIYYNAELDKFVIYNGPEADVLFEDIEVKR